MNNTSPKRYIRLKKKRHLLLDPDNDYDEFKADSTEDATTDSNQPIDCKTESEELTGRYGKVAFRGNTVSSTKLSISDMKEPSEVFVKDDTKRVISWKLKLIVFICGAIIVVGVSLIMRFRKTDPRAILIGNSAFGTAQLVLSEKTLNLVDKYQMKRLSISIGGDKLDTLSLETSQKCGDFSEDADGVCLRWPSYNATLQIVPVTIVPKEKQIQCFNVSWVFAQTREPEDCFHFDSGPNSGNMGQPVWYDTLHYILWPRKLDTSCKFSCRNYIPIMDTERQNIGGTVVEPIWFSSQGVLVTSSLHSPIQACAKVCTDASLSKLCMKTDLETVSSRPVNSYDEHEWSYTACVASNVSQMHYDVMENIVKPGAQAATYKIEGTSIGLKKSTRQLSEGCSALLDKPLWNIVLSGDTYDNESAIVRELEQVAAIGGTAFMYNMSSVFSKIGDFEFHKSANFNIQHFIDTMKRLEFSLMLPVSPFVNFDAVNFQEATERGLLLKNRLNNAPFLTEVHMLGGVLYPGIIDFTNPGAFEWFVTKVQKFLTRSNVDYIQLLYGQLSWASNSCKLNKPLSNPGFYSTAFTTVASYVGSCPLTDVAFASRHQNQVVLLKAASGLEETLKVALASGLAGYPFFIPDLPFRLEDAHGLPSDMLEDGFIRWVQLVSFFPVAHMPWDFHALKNRGVNIERIVAMVARCMELRRDAVIQSALKSAIKRAEETGHTPIISPLWMAPGLPPVSANDFAIGKAFLVEDQFMIGSDVLFAPVLQMREKRKNVYFPPGHWVKLTDTKTETISDGRHREDLDVGLDDLLIFVRKASFLKHRKYTSPN